MNTRLAFSILLAAGRAAQAQELIRINYSWQEVTAGTTMPANGPLAGNSNTDPGEGARIFIGLNILRNGTNAIGQTTTYTPPPPPGTGIIAGLGSVLYRLVANASLGNTGAGTWTNRAFASYVSGANGWAGTSIGSPVNQGQILDNFGTSQFAAPGATASGLNPLSLFFSAVWTPQMYNGRVFFALDAGSAAPPGQANTVLIKTAVIQPDPTDPTTWYDQYVSKVIGSDFGTGVRVMDIPSPCGAMVLMCLGLRRRRRVSTSAPCAHRQTRGRARGLSGTRARSTP